MKYRVTYTYYLDVEVEAEDEHGAYHIADMEAPDQYDDPHGFCQLLRYHERDIEEVDG